MELGFKNIPGSRLLEERGKTISMKGHLALESVSILIVAFDRLALTPAEKAKLVKDENFQTVHLWPRYF